MANAGRTSRAFCQWSSRSGASVATAARTIGMHEFPAGKLAEAARKWSSAEIADAINGLVELDAISKGDGERAWGPALTRWSAARIR